MKEVGEGRCRRGKWLSVLNFTGEILNFFPLNVILPTIKAWIGCGTFIEIFHRDLDLAFCRPFCFGGLFSRGHCLLQHWWLIIWQFLCVIDAISQQHVNSTSEKTSYTNHISIQETIWNLTLLFSVINVRCWSCMTIFSQWYKLFKPFSTEYLLCVVKYKLYGVERRNPTKVKHVHFFLSFHLPLAFMLSMFNVVCEKWCINNILNYLSESEIVSEWWINQ